MCVLIYKPSGVKMPSIETLRTCFNANPHGAGFATPYGSHHSMRFDAICRGLSSVSIDTPCIIHFRLATHGSIKLGNCHPFKIDDVFFAHNGVLNIRVKDDKTDSETAFKMLYPFIQKYGLNSARVKFEIDKIIGSSKFAFMRGRKVYLYGDFIKKDGCYYSNMRWQNYLPY